MTFLREARLKNKLTLTELAQRTHITLPYLSQLERGIRTNPSLQIANAIATELNISLVDLLYSFK